MQMKLGCVVLAAGQGARFGGDKMHYFVAGKPMLTHVLCALPAERFIRRLVVLPPNDTQLCELARTHGFEPVINPDPSLGVSESVRIGLATVCAGSKPDGVLFAVGDQPYLTQGSVKRLLDMFEEHPQYIVALAANGKRGNPVVFPAYTFEDFSQLDGDMGGSRVIAMHPELLLLCEAVAAKELVDIDRKD